MGEPLFVKSKQPDGCLSKVMLTAVRTQDGEALKSQGTEACRG